MRKYYLHDGNAQQGPFFIEELKSKNISYETFIWYESLNDWTEAGKIDELKTLFELSPPPFNSNIIPPKFTNPIPNSYADSLTESSTSHKNRYIGLIALGIIVIFFTIYLLNKNSVFSTEQINPLDTSAQYQNDKRKLDSLDQIEKERKLKNELLTKKNIEYRNNWKKYLGYISNNYRINSFGGIFGLEITASNQTDNIIDEIIVTIHYYKSDGSLYESKDISLNNIQPNSYKTVKVPDTNRGIRIESFISKITARSIHFCYDIEYDASNSEKGITAGAINDNPNDPWYCK